MKLVVKTLLILLLSLFGTSVWAAKSKAKALPEKGEVVQSEAKKDARKEAKKDIRNSEEDYLSGLAETVVDKEEDERVNLGNEEELVIASKDESEIPIALKAEKKETSATMKPLHKMVGALGTLILFALVLFFFIHRSGKRGMLASGAKSIKILSQKSIGPKRDLMVIKVAGESVLLGVTDHNINFIKNLSILDDEMPEISPDGFSDQLHKNLMPSKRNHTAAQGQEAEAEGEGVDGYMVSKLSDVRDVVSRRFR